MTNEFIIRKNKTKITKISTLVLITIFFMSSYAFSESSDCRGGIDGKCRHVNSQTSYCRNGAWVLTQSRQTYCLYCSSVDAGYCQISTTTTQVYSTATTIQRPYDTTVPVTTTSYPLRTTTTTTSRVTTIPITTTTLCPAGIGYTLCKTSDGLEGVCRWGACWPVVACCRSNGACEEVNEHDCIMAGSGRSMGPGSKCAASVCGYSNATTTQPITTVPRAVPSTVAPTTGHSTTMFVTTAPRTMPSTVAPTTLFVTTVPRTIPSTVAPTTRSVTTAPRTLPSTIAPTTWPATSVPRTMPSTTAYPVTTFNPWKTTTHPVTTTIKSVSSTTRQTTTSIKSATTTTRQVTTTYRTTTSSPVTTNPKTTTTSSRPMTTSTMRQGNGLIGYFILPVKSWTCIGGIQGACKRLNSQNYYCRTGAWVLTLSKFTYCMYCSDLDPEYCSN